MHSHSIVSVRVGAHRYIRRVELNLNELLDKCIKLVSIEEEGRIEGMVHNRNKEIYFTIQMNRGKHIPHEQHPHNPTPNI